MYWAVKVFLSIFVIVFLSFISHWKRRKSHPPGPLGLPYFGHKPYIILQMFLPQLFSKITDCQYHIAMKKKYGDIWSVDLGNKKIIVLSSYEQLKRTFIDNSQIFSGKQVTELNKIISKRQGIAFSDGEECMANRHLAIKSLRDLGMGTKFLENQICDEVNELIEYIEKNIHQSFSSPIIFAKPIANIISNLVFNTKSQWDDDDFVSLINNLREIFHSNRPGTIIEIFSSMIPVKYLEKIFPEIARLIKNIKESKIFIERQCRSRMALEQEFSKPNCVFDFFWRYRYQDYPNLSFKDKFSDICQTMYDLYLGGSDTTSNMLAFTFLMLGKYPKIQEDLRNELKSLVDEHDCIDINMRKDCPIMLSMMDEVQRFCVLGPRIPRRALANFKIDDYNISVDDLIFGDIESIFKDPAHFENPDVFNAYRFLDQSRTNYVPHKLLIPFGLGKRICLGESLAQMELFLFLSKLILKFSIILPKDVDNNVEKIIEGTPGFIHSPSNHEIIFTRR